MSHYYKLAFEVSEIDKEGLFDVLHKNEKELNEAELKELSERIINANQNFYRKFIKSSRITQEEYDGEVNSGNNIKL